jgi:hypothetical protein
MIYYIARVTASKEHKILGYFESMESLEETLEENKETLNFNGDGRIYKMKPGLNPERELVRTI